MRVSSLFLRTRSQPISKSCTALFCWPQRVSTKEKLVMSYARSATASDLCGPDLLLGRGAAVGSVVVSCPAHAPKHPWTTPCRSAGPRLSSVTRPDLGPVRPGASPCAGAPRGARCARHAHASAPPPGRNARLFIHHTPLQAPGRWQLDGKGRPGVPDAAGSFLHRTAALEIWVAT